MIHRMLTNSRSARLTVDWANPVMLASCICVGFHQRPSRLLPMVIMYTMYLCVAANPELAMISNIDTSKQIRFLIRRSTQCWG